jgi:hypothetical protein
MSDHIQAALSRQFLPTFWDQGRFIGADLQGNCHNLIRDGHFQIQACGHNLPQHEEIAILNMTAVLTEVNCNAIRPP